jgi:hypothetical protein
MQVIASFRDARHAAEARQALLSVGHPPEDAVLRGADTSAAATTAMEGRQMGRMVLIIALWSIIGTGAGVALGVVLHLTVGPSGTDGLIIQMVSWAVFAHLLIGMWAGYLLLADRSQRELAVAPEATLVVRCDSDEATAIAAALRRLGARAVRLTELPTGVPARWEG